MHPLLNINSYGGEASLSKMIINYINHMCNCTKFKLWSNRSPTSQIRIVHRIIEGIRAKKFEATLLLVDFTKSFDFIHWGKKEQIQRAYGLLKEIVATLMMLFINTKAMVHLPNGDTDYFNIITGVLQEDTLAPYMFIICLHWHNGYSVRQWPGRSGFNPWSSHTKDSKNGTWCLLA